MRMLAFQCQRIYSNKLFTTICMYSKYCLQHPTILLVYIAVISKERYKENIKIVKKAAIFLFVLQFDYDQKKKLCLKSNFSMKSKKV